MLSNYRTNEFNNSAVAQNKGDVITTWSEAKWMVISTVIMAGVLIVGIAKQIG